MNINGAGRPMLFCVAEPQAGKHFTLITPNRSAPQFAQALETIIASYPRADTIHLIMDNLNIHGQKSLTELDDGKGNGCGAVSPSTTRQNTVAGSIRLRSN